MFKSGHTVYAPCVEGDNSFILKLRVINDKNLPEQKEGEHVKFIGRNWINDMYKNRIVMVFQSRRKALSYLKLNGISCK